MLLATTIACGEGSPPPDENPDADDLPDTLTTDEQSNFAPDPLRYSEMRDGRLDTIDMIGEDGPAAWHVQSINYNPNLIAMTYAAWYTGADSVALFAADNQPYLVDDLGNTYLGVVVPKNPRISVESGTTAVGVYVFTPALETGAQSLRFFVNDSTPPVLEIGPFSVYHETSPMAKGEEDQPGASLVGE